MRELMTPKQFKALYIARVKALRETKFKSSDEMAKALNIGHDAYRKYESRSMMPLDLVERFALIVGVPIDFVVTGRYVRGKGPYPQNIPGPHSLDEMLRVDVDGGSSAVTKRARAREKVSTQP